MPDEPRTLFETDDPRDARLVWAYLSESRGLALEWASEPHSDGVDPDVRLLGLPALDLVLDPAELLAAARDWGDRAQARRRRARLARRHAIRREAQA